MKYMLLLANAPDAWGEPAPDSSIASDFDRFTKALHDAGVLVGGFGLHDPDAATSVRFREGKRVLIDGPFAETKEHLLGVYIIDVEDLDTALDWAARVPNVHTGTIEVRPIKPELEIEASLART